MLDEPRASDDGCQGLRARYRLSSSGSMGAERALRVEPLTPRCFDCAKWGRSRTSLDDWSAAAAALRAAATLALRLEVGALLEDAADEVGVVGLGDRRAAEVPDDPTAAEMMAACVCALI